MKKITKALLLIASFATFLALFVFFAAAEEPTMIASGKCDYNLTWSIDSEGVLTISGNGNMSGFTDLTDSNGERYSSAPWGKRKSLIKTVLIRDGVSSIGGSAFYNCDSIISVSIPNSVRSIGTKAFYDCDSLESIVIPDSVTTMGSSVTSEYSSVFYGCNSLKTVVIGNGLSEISPYMFYQCGRLESVTVGNKVTKIRERAFAYCLSLESINIPNSVTNIGSLSFFNCQAIKTIVIPDSVTNIESKAFEACTSLTTVTIGNGVNNIANSAFINCYSLTEFIVNEDNESFASDDAGCLYDKNKTEFIKYPDGKTDETFSVPDSVSSISDHAFFCCSMLSSVTVPDSVTSIGPKAFGPDKDYYPRIYYYPLILCNKDSNVAVWAEENESPYGFLDGTEEENTIQETVNSKLSYSIDRRTRTLTIHNKGIMSSFSSYEAPWKQYQKYVETVVVEEECSSISVKAFYEFIHLRTVSLPNTIKIIDEDAFRYCELLQAVIIPDQVTEIGARAFSSCNSLTSVAFPDCLTSIGYASFGGCINLISVIIPDSVTNIGDAAFANCSRLTNITISNSVTSIGSSVFSDCSSLENVTIPNSVTSIDFEAFYNCYALTNVTIPDSVTSIGSGAFCGCSSLTCMTIPDSVTSIGRNAFSDCCILTSVTIGNGMTNVGISAFKNCTKLYKLLLGNGVSNIEDNAFYNCSSLEALTIPGSTKTIGKEAFRNCTGLTELTLEEGIQSIGANAFAGCTSLESVVIPHSVTALSPSYSTLVDYGVFKGCTGLQSAVVGNGVTYLPAGMFSGCTSLESVQLGDNVETIYASAFSGCSSLPTVVFGNKVKTIQQNVFSGCSSLWAVDLPASVTSLGSRAFSDSSLQNITIRAMNCTIPNDAINIRTTIHGYEGSSAQTFADTYGYPFELITDTPIHDHTAGITAQKDRKPATCEAAGSYDLVTYCSYCGSEMSRETIVEGAALGHSFGAWYDSVNVSCYADGKQRRDCVRCEAYETRVVFSSGHSFSVWTVTTNATCTEPGVESRVCSKCGFTEMQFSNVLGHVEKVYSKAASCKEAGYNITVCVRCGDTLSSEIFPLQEHKWDDGVSTQESTCTAQGMMTYTCQICGATKTEPTDLRAHQWNDGVITKEPTCSEMGEMTYTCQIGGETRTEPIDKLEHEIVLVEGTAPTCTETGLTDGWQCKNCKKWFAKQQVIDATNHTPGNMIIENEIFPTCTKDGGFDYVVYCTGCGVELSREYMKKNATGHTPKTEATCESKAVCSLCNQEFGSFNMNNHPAEKIVVDPAVPATCTQIGLTQGKHCSACGAIIVEQRIVPMLSHCGGTATCVTKAVCSVCKSEYGEVNPYNHQNIVKVPAKPATCVEKGLTEGQYCESCKATIKPQKTVPMAAHTPRDESIPAVCTTDGVQGRVICTVCKVVLDHGKPIPAPGHTWSNWRYSSGYDCTKGGEMTRRCTVCDVLDTKAVSPRSHDYAVTKTIDATCTKAGEKTYTCSLCGAVKAETIAVLGHIDKDEDGICDRCNVVVGEPKPQSLGERISAFFNNIIDKIRNFFAGLFGGKKEETIDTKNGQSISA